MGTRLIDQGLWTFAGPGVLNQDIVSKTWPDLDLKGLNLGLNLGLDGARPSGLLILILTFFG
ncbi:hypothetical protein CTA1_3994 [Colletotrichum tanaceti]|uniref:Uncharacterized protein n=1 Tax=Colletotrichum tanaceti TaxID=1306861 RepID=A0A4U6X246_9PEZI|nr:hypothetical protein CTA1_3994 [Colletotrichum tanaceti]